MDFEEWWIDMARSEESDELDTLDLGQQAILAGWVKKAWNAAVAGREERIRTLTVELDNQYEENVSLIVTLADREERIWQRDGEWVDAIEDTLHFGIIPETLAGAIGCMKAWLEEREGRVRKLEEQLAELPAQLLEPLPCGHPKNLESGRVSRTCAVCEKRNDLQARIERAKGLAAEMQNAGKSRRCMHIWEAGDVIALSDVEDWANELLAALDGETKGQHD